MNYFWTWFVRNPMFLVAGAGVTAGVANIVPWGVALWLITAGVVLGDAAWHCARKAQMRDDRKLAEEAAARSSIARTRERFTDYTHAEGENVA